MSWRDTFALAALATLSVLSLTLGIACAVWSWVAP